MQWYHYVLIILGILLTLDIIIVLLLWIGTRNAFAHRYDGNPNLKYFTYRDFPDLRAEEFSFTSNKKQTLVGLIYRSKDTVDDGRMILFFHGIGAGHEAYTKEIRLLIQLTKLPVIAFDYTGCGRSFGKQIIGLTQPLIDADYFLRYLSKTPPFKHQRFIVIGHSWGAYVANNLSALKPSIQIDKVVTMSGFVHPSIEMAEQIKFPLLKPFFAQLSFITFGRYHFYRSDRSLKKSGIDSLIIHGKKDAMVSFQSHAAWLLKAASRYPHLTLLACEKKKHNPYLTIEAEEGLLDVLRKDRQFVTSKKVDTPEAKKFYENIDYDFIGQNDVELFKLITHFIHHGGEIHHGKTHC